ncbi:MAG: hypothetical protein ABSB90_00785 [Thermoplasmata archaeon]
MSASPVSTAPNTTFVIVLFAVAIVVGVVIAYLGIAGIIGGPIP